MKTRLIFSLASLALVSASAVAAQEAGPVITSVTPPVFALGNRLTFEVDYLDRLCPDRKPDQPLRLFLNDEALPGIVAVHESQKRVRFDLEPSWARPSVDGEPNAWARLVSGSLFRERTRKVQASLGYEACPGAVARTPPVELNFIVLPDGWMWTWLASMAMIVLLTVWLGRRTPLLREGGQNGPYSLARAQMAFWTVLALGAFLLILMSTGSIATLNSDVLTLLGISAATGLGAAVVDSSKETELERKNVLQQQEAALRQAALAQPQAGAQGSASPQVLDQWHKVAMDMARLPSLQKQSALGFFTDILKDENGFSVYRLQFVLWTLVLGGYFLYAVVSRLMMPSFSIQLLTLMGISSGTYVTLKTQEKQV